MSEIKYPRTIHKYGCKKFAESTATECDCAAVYIHLSSDGREYVTPAISFESLLELRDKAQP